MNGTPPMYPYFLASTTYSGRIPTASHEKSSLWVQGYITSFSHARGRAPLNVHAASKFLGHLGLEIQKMKQIKFESLKSKIELVGKVFLESLIILGHLGLWFQKFLKSFKFETQPQIED